MCFVSSADRVGIAGHGQLIATPTTLALVGRSTDAGHLAVPVRRPFTLGTLRLELIPSGRCLGGAALHVDARGKTVLYAGAVRTTGDHAAEVRACDALVVDAPFGLPHHVFPPVVDRLLAWVRAELAAAKIAVLVVDTPLDGLELAGHFADLAVAGSKSVRDAQARLTDANISVPAIAAITRDTAVVIRTERERVKLPPRREGSEALVSGRALDDRTYSVGFAWPFAAGRDQLLAWIEQTKAQQIFVTGVCADAIVATLGARARVFGPPRQMTLFEATR